MTRSEDFALLIKNAMVAIVTDACEMVPELHWSSDHQERVANEMTKASWAVLNIGMLSHTQGLMDF